MAINGGVYGGVQIGDYAFVDPSDTPNIIVEQIPRALGVVIKFLGGGEQTITLSGWVVNFKERVRKDLEEYFRDLPELLLAQSPASLIVNGVTYTNCFYNGFSPGGSGKHFDTFTVTFLRSSVGGLCLLIKF